MFKNIAINFSWPYFYTPGLLSEAYVPRLVRDIQAIFAKVQRTEIDTQLRLDPAHKAQGVGGEID